MFSKHMLTTKHWFGRISYTNKKRYLLTLLHDIRSAWALSLLLKSIWNCRPKDAVMSVCDPHQWYSTYDEAPMDHNRTAIPSSTLKQTMKNDRQWFLSLAPEGQALMLSELLTVAGGPAMWEVLRRAQAMYDTYSRNLMQSISQCTPVDGKAPDHSKTRMATNVQVSPPQHPPPPTTMTPGQKDVETNLAVWNATIKSLRDSLKLEEVEMTFVDGTTKKVWKVNRPIPDVMETVDFLQLLPSSIGKRILSYLPIANFNDYARVNKYWAYLIEEYRMELAVRAKLNTEISALNAIIMKYDDSFDDLGVPVDLLPAMSDHGVRTSTTFGPHVNVKNAQSVKASERSGGGYSLRYFCDKLTKPPAVPKPIRNMKELNERLNIRGAVDENLWKWCENVVAGQKKGTVKRKERPGILKKSKKNAETIFTETRTGVIDSTAFNNLHFPCPLMKKTIDVPLKPPLYKDPAKIPTAAKPKPSMSDSALPHLPTQPVKRYGLWTRDVSPLYPVLKIPSHQFPI